MLLSIFSSIRWIIIFTLYLYRQKLRKYIKNEFDEDVAKFRENPDEDDDIKDAAAQEEKDDEDDDSDDEIPDKSDFVKETFKKGMIY